MNRVGEQRTVPFITELDGYSGLPVTRITEGIGHAHHFYFTSDGHWGDGNQLLVAQEDEQGNDLWSIDLTSGVQTRLTDLPADGRDPQMWAYAAKVPVRDEVVFWYAGELRVLDLQTADQRTLWQLPAGWHESCLSVSCDGAAALLVLNNDMTSVLGKMDGTDTARTRQNFLADRVARVVEVDLASGQDCVLHEIDHLLGHPNGSPTDPDLLTFCHEGPWLEIDHRIWGLRRSGGPPWQVGPEDRDWGIGHEYWLDDGQTVGFHARRRGDDWAHCAGFVSVTGDEYWHAPIACPTQHAHARQRDRVIIDGTRRTGEFLMAVDRDGDGWAAPRILCRHGSSRSHHRIHVHARVAASADRIVFTTDKRGYGSVQMIDLPADLSTLPAFEEPPYMYYWQ